MTRKDLQIVLNEMFASKDHLLLADVGGWQEKYPEFRREIIEAYTDWRDLEFFAPDDEEIDEDISADDHQFIGNLLAKARPQAITDLRETLKKKGIERETFRQKLGFSETLLRKLERRIFSDFPVVLEKKVVEILDVLTENWRGFLALPVALPENARYKSKNAPKTQPKQSFAEAVKSDPELTEAEKRKLLDLINE